MVNIETNFWTDQVSDAKSDVSSDVKSDVRVTHSDVSVEDFITVQLPQGLPLSDAHSEYKLNKKRGTDLNAYFVGYLVKRNQFKRKKINEFVPINSNVWRNIFGGNYRKYLQRLIELEIIEQYSRPTTIKLHNGKVWKHNGTYSTALGISKKYRLLVNPSTPLQEYKIKDKALVRKINNVRIKKVEYLIKNNPTAKKVYDSIKKITIDYDGALEFIKNEYDFNTQVQWAKNFINRPNASAKTLRIFIREFLNAKTKLKKRQLLIENELGSKFNTLSRIERNKKLDGLADSVLHLVKNYARFQSRLRWIKIVDAIQKGNHSLISMTEDKWSGRIYHTFTLTARNIRPFMKLDGETLVEFDGGNCQWMLFIKLCNRLCKPSFYSKTIEDYGIKQEKTEQEQGHNTSVDLSLLHSFFNTNESKVNQELLKLTAYLNTNKLRQMVVDAEFKRGVIITEAKAKQFLIANVLFGNVNDKGYNQYKSVQAFKSEFPTLLQIIKNLKKNWIDESVYGYKPKDIFGRSLRYKAFPRLLQRMESDVFVKGMKDAECDFLTLHDAIVTNYSGEVEVKNTLDKIIKQDNSNIKLKYKVYEESI